MTARVFAVQQPTRRDEAGGVVPSMDLRPAEAFGEVVFLLHRAHNPFTDPDETAAMVEEALRREGYGDADYLLLVGNPILIGVVAAVAGSFTSRLRLLQWQRNTGGYESVDVQLPALARSRSRG